VSHSHTHSHGQESQGLLSPFLARQRYKHASRYVSDVDIVLDIGCGAGGFETYLPAGAEYYGIDSEKQWGGAPAHLYQVDVGKPLPKALQSKKFTAVTALAVIEHLKEPGTLFNDVSKILLRKGKFILTTPHPLARKVHEMGARVGMFSYHADDEHESFLNKKDLTQLAVQEGFEMVAYRRFLLGMNQVAVFVKKK
jgi:2-polyprenyl-3-methyl-5-hydroxy-6-metoxy-1,4-benzoquinol methylase